MPQVLNFDVDESTGGEWAARAARHDLTYDELAQVLLAVANTDEELFEDAVRQVKNGMLDPTAPIDRGGGSVRRPANQER